MKTLPKSLFFISSLTLAVSTAGAQNSSSAQDVLQEYDNDNNGALSQQEFQSLYQDKLASQGQSGQQTSSSQSETYVTIGTVSDVYSRWAGDDNELSIDEWDTSVDQLFGEEAVNLSRQNWDSDGNGTISMNEFEQGISSSRNFQMSSSSQGQSNQSQSQIPQFSQADMDGNGELSIEEARQALPQRITLNDANNDGVLNREEAQQAVSDVSFTSQGSQSDPVEEAEYQQIVDAIEKQ